MTGGADAAPRPQPITLSQGLALRLFFRIDSLDDFKSRRAEVDEQSVFDAGRAQVVDQLRDMDRGDLLVAHAGESVSLTLHAGMIP